VAGTSAVPNADAPMFAAPIADAVNAGTGLHGMSGIPAFSHNLCC